MYLTFQQQPTFSFIIAFLVCTCVCTWCVHVILSRKIPTMKLDFSACTFICVHLDHFYWFEWLNRKISAIIKLAIFNSVKLTLNQPTGRRNKGNIFEYYKTQFVYVYFSNFCFLSMLRLCYLIIIISASSS